MHQHNLQKLVQIIGVKTHSFSVCLVPLCLCWEQK